MKFEIHRDEGTGEVLRESDPVRARAERPKVHVWESMTPGSAYPLVACRPENPSVGGLRSRAPRLALVLACPGRRR